LHLIDKAPRGAVIALAVIAGSCAIAACGSSSSTSTAVASASSTTSSSGSGGFAARRAALVACLKSHGVTLPARPAGAVAPGSGTATTAGAGAGGFFRNNPNAQTAFRACGANFGFRGRGRFGRVSHQAIQNYVTCIRQHGYSKMPNPNFSGKGPIFPASIRSNPHFQAASRSCQNLLVRPGGTVTSSSASSA
jgi:hypothetical protein